MGENSRLLDLGFVHQENDVDRLVNLNVNLFKVIKPTLPNKPNPVDPVVLFRPYSPRTFFHSKSHFEKIRP